jgi:hypothetical protein
MCVIPTESGEPAATHLYTAPVQCDGEDCTLLVYVNNLVVDAARGPALMIVPIPNPTGTDRFHLVDYAAVKPWCAAVEEAAKIDYSRTFGAKNAADCDGDDDAPKLAVHTVGNYAISVAPNLEALHRRIDWTRFRRPADLDRRLAILSDTKTMPCDGAAAFVVAEATTTVIQDGFGVIYPGLHAYWPTCHEGKAGEPTEFDVRCYGVNMKCGPGADAPCSRKKMAPVDAALRGAIPCVATDTGAATMATPLPAQFVSRVSFKGLYANENLFGTAFRPFAVPSLVGSMFGRAPSLKETIHRALAAAPEHTGRFPVKPFRRAHEDPYSSDW